MTISLLDIKNGQKIRRKDEEEVISSSTQPTINSSNQTINLADIRSGKSSIKPLTLTKAETNIENNNTDNKQTQEVQEKKKTSKDLYKQFLKEYKKDTGNSYESDTSSVSSNLGITIQDKLARNKDKEKLKRANEYAKKSETYQEYLKTLESEKEIKKQKKQEKLQKQVDEHDTNLWDSTGRQLTSQILPAIKNVGLGLATTADPMNSKRYEQIAKDTQSTKSQMIADKAYQENDNKILKVGQDLLRTTGNMVPSLAVSVVNPTAGLMTSGFSAGGSAFAEGVKEGKDYDEAYVYGALQGTKEAMLQKALGGISAYGNSTLQKYTGKTIDNAFSKLIKNPTVRNYLGNMISEGSEEYIQEILNPVVRNLAYGENNEFKLVSEDALYSGMLGALNSSLLNSPGAIQSSINQKQQQKAVQKAMQEKAITNTIEKNNLTKTEVQQPTLNKNNVEQNVNTLNLGNQTIQNKNGITNPNQSIANTVKALNLGQNQTVTNKNIVSNINSQNVANPSNIGTNNAINNTNFSKQVDEVMNGTYPKRDMLVVSQNTPKIIQELGIKDLPITMTQKHLDTIVNQQGNRKNVHYHGLGVDLVKQIPEALSRPLNILQSDTKDNSIVVVTDLADSQERPVIASIEINGKGTIQDIRIDSNVMTSAYGRNNYDNFMQNNITKGNLLYDIDEGVIKQKRDNVQGLQLPNEVISTKSARDRVQFPMRGDSSVDNISQNGQNVNFDIPTTNNNMQKSNKNAKNEFYENKIDDDVLVIKDSKNTKENKTTEKATDDKIANLLNKRPERAKKTLKEQFQDTLQKTVNKGYYIDKLAEKTGNKELTYKYDKMLSSQGEGHYSIGVAQTDNNGNKIGKSIIDIWKPVEKANKVEEFSDYLLHKHNIDRYEQGKPVFGESVTSEMSTEKVNEYEKINPEFKEWAKDINTYNKNNLRNMVEAGLTSAETEEYLNNVYSNYVRINRNINGSSPIQQTSKGIKVNSPLKKAKGGNQDILPLKDSMAEQTLAIKNAIRRNQFGLELLNTLNTGEDIEYNGTDFTIKDSEGQNSFVNKTEDGRYYFTVYKDGKPIRMEIDEGLYEGIKPSSKSKIEDTLPLKVIQKASNWQRNVLTINNPLFIATNFFKDLGDAPLNSKYASKFAKNYIKAVQEISTKGELYNMYMANGGSQNTYFDYDKGVKTESNNKLTKIVKKINNINEAVEQAPRLAEFISTIEAGGSLTEAMYNAAEITTNFKRGGDLTKAINRNGANFLNASVQGFDKQIRNFSKQNGARGYINILSKAIIFGVAPSVLNDLMFGDDDEEYEDLPEYVKDSYFLFKTNDGKFIRIPKGRVTSIFGSAARRTLNTIKGKEDAWDGFITQTINQVAPNNPLEDNIFAPWFDISNNRSWNGSEIVPQRLQNQSEKNQYDEKTDAISKWLGGKLNISPKKINYLLDQYTGGIGDIGLPLITPQARQDPISAKFTTDSVLNNKNVSIFYDTADKLTKKKNEDDVKDADVLSYKYMNSKKLALSDLYKEKRNIQNNTKLSNKQKYNKVRDKQKEINDFVKDALDEYNEVKINGNYAIVGEFRYKKDKNGKWVKQRSK